MASERFVSRVCPEEPTIPVKCLEVYLYVLAKTSSTYCLACKALPILYQVKWYKYQEPLNISHLSSQSVFLLLQYTGTITALQRNPPTKVSQVMSHINVIIGTAGHTDLGMGFLEKSVIQHSFDILSKYGIKHLGTAQIYGNGNVEAFLGETAPAGTKWPGGFTSEWMCAKTQSLYF
jgi:hypothetical protein